MGISRRRFLELTATAGAAAMIPRIAIGQDAVTFEGETIEWVIPFGEGGGSDAWARFFSPYLGKHLPGAPDVFIRNVPGGGSITGTNNFAARAQDDGLTLIGVSASTQFPFLLGDSNVRYDYKDFVPVLASPTGGVVYIPSSFEVADASGLAALRERELVFANTGPTSLDLVFVLAFELLGLNVRHVFGMGSRGETRVAFERGEATIDWQSTASYLSNVTPMIEEGMAVPLFTVGALDADGNIVRDPTFPDLPHVLEVYEMVNGAPPESSEMLDAYVSFFSAGFPAQKMAMLAKSTPQNIVDAYREAFAAAVADPELQERKGDILGDYEQATGAAADRLFEIATTISPEAKAWMREYLQTNFSVEL